MKALYDDIGIDYAAQRRTEPRIAARLYAHLKGATRIVNIGAGTGNYEPDGADLVAVEPSSEMIAQRKPGAAEVVCAAADRLPFEDGAFSHAMTVLSLHHWTNREAAFDEINRVATEGFVTLTLEATAPPFWLTQDYFPDIYRNDLAIFPSIDDFRAHFDEVEVTPVMIPEDCIDGFLAAFWKRPAAYLDPRVRQSISAFSKVSGIEGPLARLKDDLESGSWAEKNASILDLPALDAGYRIVSARTRYKGK